MSSARSGGTSKSIRKPLGASVFNFFRAQQQPKGGEEQPSEDEEGSRPP
jgi:hypothetical protein